MAATDDAVRREIHVAAPPAAVFRFFTEPAEIVRWIGREATLDPTPGGIFRLVMNAEAVASGRYVEVTPPSRVVFTWGWEGEGSIPRPGESTVEVNLIPDGEGTLVRLIHRGLSPAERDRHGQGWDHFLPFLPQAAATPVGATSGGA